MAAIFFLSGNGTIGDFSLTGEPLQHKLCNEGVILVTY
jgi:hypothetical protein